MRFLPEPGTKSILCWFPIMRKMKITIQEYAALFPKFNPVGFDARAWVKLEKDAGMKYLVITAKHHDGFAMFHSKVSAYNIVDATPFWRDPLAELVAACREAEIKLGFYYSQDQDWHEPGGSGNDWEVPAIPHTFAEYLENKVKPQLRELLTNYGPVAVIWFDTPYCITELQSRELKELVHSIQPDCLVSGRVGHDLGDYSSLGDNVIPAEIPEGIWEGLGTTNESCGYKVNDRQWKSSWQLLRIMAGLFSKDTNYLLNVGPGAAGRMPEVAQIRLREVERWLRDNGEAVYGTWTSPFRLEFTEKHLSVSDYHKLAITLPEKKSGELPEVLMIETQDWIYVNKKSYDAAGF